MHWILLLLRLLLNLLGPTDGLSLAARADGRLEQVPAGPTLWADWLSRVRRDIARSAGWALALRARDKGRDMFFGRSGPRGRGS